MAQTSTTMRCVVAGFVARGSAVGRTSTTTRCSETWSPGKLPFDVVLQYVQELIKVIQSSAIESVDHDAQWFPLVSDVRQPGTYAPNCSMTECDAHIRRKLSPIGGTQHVHVRRKSGTLFVEMSLMEWVPH